MGLNSNGEIQWLGGSPVEVRGGPTNVVRGVITLIRLSELRFVSVICEV